MRAYYLLFLCLVTLTGSFAQNTALEPMDIFDLKYISDPQISPDGSQIIYVLNSKDVMNDANRTEIWKINQDGSQNFPLIADDQRAYSPRWSPDGEKLLYLSGRSGRTQMYIHWLKEGTASKVYNFRS